jgi:transposase
MPRIKATDFTGQTFYVGLDVHKKSWNVSVRTMDFEVAHFSQKPDVQALSRYLTGRYPGGDFVSAYEAGFCGTTLHHALCEAGIKNIVVHPADIPQTDKQRKNKSDVHDSRAAARYLEAGVLTAIYIMPAEQQERRALFRLRATRVKDVTRCNNRLRSLLYFLGIPLPEAFKDKQYLSCKILDHLRTVPLLTQQGREVLDHYIEDLLYQRQQLALITKQLKASVLSLYKDAYNSVITAPGIGAVLAMALLSEVGDFSRFTDPDEYCSYLGLAPSKRSSAGRIYSEGMQPRCNRYLRPLLIEAAWQAIRFCPVMLHYYRKHAAKGEKKAIVKVAAKLALIARALIINHSVYNSGG